MKSIFVFLISLFLLISCESDGKLTSKSQETGTISSSAVLKYSGEFYPTSGITVSGFAKIYLENNQFTVKLEDFTISDGPDLKVYISKESTPTNFNKLEMVSLENLDLSYFNNDYEKYYLIDIAGMAMWNDGKIEDSERIFLFQLAKKLVVSDSFVEKSILDMNLFLTTNKDKIPYFNFSNPVKHFYDQTTQNVHTLISRNKNRLILEISQSKELMKLLSQSTKRDLSPEEKKKVRNQLLDICKTIPSLTIFLIPGGSLLLPILIKFIPQLLPSAFNENLEKE